MHYLKYFLIILFSSLLLTSCGDPDNEDNPDTSLEGEVTPPPAMNPESNIYAGCIKGVYEGEADFKRYSIGKRDYKLEVNYNSSEIIFLLTNAEQRGLGSGSQICTIYRNPYFSPFSEEEGETLFNIESDSVENKGVIINTVGVFSIVSEIFTSSEREREPEEDEGIFSTITGIFTSSEQTEELGEDFCGDISEFKLSRQPEDDPVGSWRTVGTPNPEASRVTDEEVRSFDELKNDCNELVPSGEAETTDNSAQPQETESQNPTQ